MYILSSELISRNKDQKRETVYYDSSEHTNNTDNREK